MKSNDRELCMGLYESAPWCGGPSLKECPDGTEVPEDAACPDMVPPTTAKPECWYAEPRCDVGPPPVPSSGIGSCEQGGPAFGDGTECDSISCEEIGTCDHTENYDLEVAETSSISVSKDDIPMLAETGISDPSVILLLGLASVAAGIGMLRKVR